MSGDALPWLMLIVKLGLYCASLAAAGLALNAALGVVEADGRTQALRRAAWAATAAAGFGALRLLLTNAQLAGSLADAFDAATVAWAWTAQGPSMSALGASLVAAWAAFLFRSRIIAAFSALGFAAAFALVGHVQALPAPGFAPWVAGAHVLIASFWFAAPLTLWPSAAIDAPTLAGRVRRFSALAIAAIPALVALGLWLLWRLAWPAIFSSEYGLVLVVKLVVVTLALGLGALNKTVVAKALATDPGRGAQLLSWTLRVDAVIFLTALALVAWATTMTGPPEM